MFISLIAPAAALPSSRPTLFKNLRQMIAIARQRKTLAKLDDAQLRDIGITRTEAKKEASRAPWNHSQR